MAPKTKNPFRKRGKKTRAKKTTVSVAVKKYVKKILATDQENKVINTNISQSFGSVINNAVMNYHPILPYAGFNNALTQGVGAGSRIGNQVKVRKVTLNYILRPIGYVAGSNPFPQPTHVQLFLGTTKGCPGEIPSSGDFQNLFQAGNAVQAPTGLLNDLVCDINKDYWTIKKRWTHKLGYASYTGSGGATDSMFSANNDFKLNILKKLDITKLCPKVLKFNDNNGTVSGPNLMFFYSAMFANGGAMTNTTITCNITYWINMEYEDA